MKGIKFLIAATAMLGFVSIATAEVHLNEIYISHAGTDDQEFIELFGSGSLDNIAVLVIEGTSALGNIDRVFDLNGQSVPGDGYFVLGGDAVTNLDFSVGATNILENDTETFVLLDYSSVGSPPAVNTDLDADDDEELDNPLSDLGTVLDIVGAFDGGTGVTYGGAITVGPDGSFMPAGIFRGNKANGVGDYPEQWNFTQFLDFDDVQNGGPADNQQMRTPGTMNVPEPATLAMLLIGGLAIRRRR